MKYSDDKPAHLEQALAEIERSAMLDPARPLALPPSL
jgi:hypothetical protein